MPNLLTSKRVRNATESLDIINPYLQLHDIHGYADHTPKGISYIRSIEVLRGNPRSGYMNLGKGFGFEAALASGFMEALEMSTIENHPMTNVCNASDIYASNHKAHVYLERKREVIPLESMLSLCSQHPIIQGSDLITGSEIYGLCYDHYLPRELSASNHRLSTNGLASGNTVDEAQLHAIYEVIERHIGHVALQSVANVKTLCLIDTPSPLLEAICEVEALGMQCKFFLLGCMLDVSVVQCTLVFKDSFNYMQPKINFGWGSHTSLAIAVSRSLCEAVQIFSIRKAIQSDLIPQSRLNGGLLVSASALRQLKSDSSRQEHSFYFRLCSCPTISVALEFDDDDESSYSLTDSLARIICLMHRSNISSLFSWKLSSDEYPFAVVKCVIPEFQSFTS
jgi:ribosomal protein S12 methylthiotransferase accessory factor YcaO